MKKPSGFNGVFRVTVNADHSVTGDFVPVKLPEKKSDVELVIVEHFISSMRFHLARTGDRFDLSNPQANEENDFDFTISTQRGLAYLELMEIAPLTGPYEKAPAHYKPYDLAKKIMRGIEKKSSRYPRKMKKELILLLYVTHWKFLLNTNVCRCLRNWCSKEDLAFNRIFTFHYSDETPDAGTPTYIYPVPPDMRRFDPELIKDNIVINLDPHKWQITTEPSGSPTDGKVPPTQ